MTNQRLRIWFAILVALSMAVTSMACEFSFNFFGGPTATPTAVPATATPASCAVPDLVGMSSKAAESALTDLGLTPLRTAGFSSTVPEGSVMSQEPVAGTLFSPCQGDVTMVVSLGPSAVEASPTPVSSPTSTPGGSAATRTPTKPAPTATIVAGPLIKNPAGYDLLYKNDFALRDAYGLLKSPSWRKVAAGTGSKVKSENGILSITGRFEFYGGGAYAHRVRVRVDGELDKGLVEFSMFVNYQDNQNTLQMACAGGDPLKCDWFLIKGGKSTRLTSKTFELCSGICSVQVELDGDEVRTYANGAQKSIITDTTYPTGLIGFRIDTPATAEVDLYDVIVYEIPKETNGKVLFREDFGDDINLEPFNGTYLSIVFDQGDGFLRAKATAKESGNFRTTPNNAFNLPEKFQLTLSARIVGGPKDGLFGVAFQRQKDNSFYFASLDNQGRVGVSALINDKWDTIIGATAASGYRAGQANTLTVTGDGSKYNVLLNGKSVSTFTDDRLSNGTFSLGLELSHTGDQMTVEYYLLEVRR